jgi:hypothetical protein
MKVSVDTVMRDWKLAKAWLRREARLLAAFTDEPTKVTIEQARRWAAEFNSWEIVDTASDLFCDAGLQSEVQSLLEQSSSTDGFLETSPVAHFMTQSAGSVLVGRRLGVFEVHALLGMGGMGEVYRARDTRLGRDVAIKILPSEFTATGFRRVRFEREARALAS